MFQTKVIDKIKTRFMYVQYIFSDNRVFYEIMWKKWWSQTTDGDTAHAHCMLDT